MSGFEPSGADLVAHFVAVAIADGCVLIGWLVIAALVIVGVRRWRAGKLAQLEPGTPEEPTGGMRWLVYGVSLLFWPAALGFGLYFLTRPAGARAGAICIWILLGFYTFAVLLAIAIVTTGAVLAPEWFML